ncbi:hypothetical protein MRB53_040027 [Persea americana]|nr:hypothetical protein MRB53_040027 [Persea americana]
MGGVTADKQGAYALLLAYDDELSSTSAEKFTYRSHATDKARYRLTSATRDGRQPIRVLRGHNLRSFWSPRAGVRYDGLYRVVGWAIRFDRKSKETIYDIQFERLPTETPMEIVLRRPLTDEVEDYKAYVKMRHQEKDIFTHSDSHLSMLGPAFESR